MSQLATVSLSPPTREKTRPIVIERGEAILGDAPWTLDQGGALAQVRVGYQLEGAAGAPVIVVLGGISADRAVVTRPDGAGGWWSTLFGRGRAVSTELHRVLSFDFLGGNGATTGARTPCGSSTFPDVTTFDQAHVLARLLDHLGIERVKACVGASYGGMVALAFAQRFASRLEQAIVISAAHRSATLPTAWRIIERRILALAETCGRGEEGLELARALAMTTYRTGEELDERFFGARRGASDPDDFPVWGYLKARGEAYVRSMAPSAFATLSRSIDLHAIDPERISTPLTLVAVRQDLCVPHALTLELGRRVRGPCATISLDSLYGHDAFLKEESFFAELFARRI